MDWLTNDQNIDPFEPGNHMTVERTAHHMQRYWNKVYKNQGVKALKKKKSAQNFRGNSGMRYEGKRGSDDEASTNVDGDGGTSRYRDDEVTEDNKKRRACCPIQGHQRYQHGWEGCPQH